MLDWKKPYILSDKSLTKTGRKINYYFIYILKKHEILRQKNYITKPFQ